MIDIHSHILPKMDDGSASLEETNKLLDMLWHQGVTTVVATPHFYATKETPESFLQRRAECLAQMPAQSENRPKVLIGAEVAYFPGIGNCDAIIPLQIGNTGLLLVEMPFCSWTDRMVEEICDIPSGLGLTPILAHVNRYRGSKQFPKYMQKLSKSGVYFQCNAEAFESLSSRRWALNLMKKGYLHFLGSDCHNLTSRPPKIDLAAEAMEKKLGAKFINYFNENAESMLF